MGRLFGEGPALSLARLYQEATGFHRRHPDLSAVQPTVANFIQMIAEGDLVVLATVRSYTNAAAPYASTWFDMFRVSDAKLVEHWDTGTLPVQ